MDADGRSSGPVATLVKSPSDDSRNPDWACSLRHHKGTRQRRAQIDWHLFVWRCGTALLPVPAHPGLRRRLGRGSMRSGSTPVGALGRPRNVLVSMAGGMRLGVVHGPARCGLRRVDRPVDRLHFDERGEGVLGNTRTTERLRAMVDGGCFRSRREGVTRRRVAGRRRSWLVRGAVAVGSLLRRAFCHTDGSCWSICWGPSRSR